MVTLKGSCHCNRVTFELGAKPEYAVYCNCSICRKRNALWTTATDATLKILTGEPDLQLYQFNTKTAKHYFCRHCGIHPFARPRINPNVWVVNLRCVDGVDLDALPVKLFDGEHWEEAAKAFLAQRKPSP